MTDGQTPALLSVCHARYVGNLARSLTFYRDLLGFPVEFAFDSPTGGGAILRLLGTGALLELIQDDTMTSQCLCGRDASHLVLRPADRAAVDALVERLEAAGRKAVTPDNAYWTDRAVTVLDPDRYQVVIAFPDIG